MIKRRDSSLDNLLKVGASKVPGGLMNDTVLNSGDYTQTFENE